MSSGFSPPCYRPQRVLAFGSWPGGDEYLHYLSLVDIVIDTRSVHTCEEFYLPILDKQYKRQPRSSIEKIARVARQWFAGVLTEVTLVANDGAWLAVSTEHGCLEVACRIGGT